MATAGRCERDMVRSKYATSLPENGACAVEKNRKTK